MKLIQLSFLFLLLLAVLLRIVFAFAVPPALRDGQQVEFETTLLTEPTLHRGYESITVTYRKGLGVVPIVLDVPLNSALHYGQVVHIVGKIHVHTITLKAKVLRNEKPTLTISSPVIRLNSEKQNLLFSLSYLLRVKIQSIYQQYFSQKDAALLLGIVLGVRGNFPKEFLSDLQAAGVMHVIAASGMNVAMVSGFFLGLFGAFFKRQWAIALTLLSVVFYCIVSGLQASILRATIMISFALIGQMFGKQYNSLYGLFLAGAVMLLYNPLWAVDVGFQLSFAATLGIFFIQPILPYIGLAMDDVATTIAAQIATLPILIGSFGSYGILSIIVNAFVLWTIPPLMVLGGVGGLIGLFFAPFSQVLFFLCLPFLWFFEQVVAFFGKLQWQLSMAQIPIPLMVGYYLLVISGVWIFKKRIGFQVAKREEATI